jgi:hypothetical protein
MIGILPCLGEGEGRVSCCLYGFSRDAQLRATVNTNSWLPVKHLYLHDVMEITNGQQWQNFSQNLCSGKELNAIARGVAEFLLHKCKKIIKSKFRALNT